MHTSRNGIRARIPYARWRLHACNPIESVSRSCGGGRLPPGPYLLMGGNARWKWGYLRRAQPIRATWGNPTDATAVWPIPTGASLRGLATADVTTLRAGHLAGRFFAISFHNWISGRLAFSDMCIMLAIDYANRAMYLECGDSRPTVSRMARHR